jgi:hypothetical protein
MPPLPIDIAIGFTVLPSIVLATFSIILLKHSKSLWWIVAMMCGWMAFTGFMAYSGPLAEFASSLPWIPMLALVQLAFIFWLGWFSSWSDVLAKIPQVVLVGLQCFRLPVELLLATLGIRRLLAIEMTYYGRNFDVLVGLTAIILAIWVKRRGEQPLRHVVLLWNVMGLSLITVVLAHGLLSIPYPSQLLHLSVPTFIIAQFPVVWLLTVLVPMAYLLHLASIKRCLAIEPGASKPKTLE